jgi:serpin B
MRRSPRTILVSIIVFTLLIACTHQVSTKQARSNLLREADPAVANDDITTLVDGNDAFAFNLYQSLRSGAGNDVFSPYSISLALAMTYAGARNETGSQMAAALHFALPQEKLHPAFNKLDQSLTQEGKDKSNKGQLLQLDIANAIWAEQTFTFLQPYLDLLAINYGAGLQQADFINESAKVQSEINQWVSDQTSGKIKDLIPAGAIDPMTKLVLVNAVYFKADWANPFNPTYTTDLPFHLLDGTVTPVKMMSKSISGILYSSGAGYKAVELDYTGNTAAMDILVPDEGNFDTFEGQLSADRFNGILNGMQPTALDLGLPKFSFSSNTNLDQQLSSLGMPDAFNANNADFSGMTGGRELFINKAIHQAFVTVDEKGTEAAAATAVTMQPTNMMVQREKLTIDRPFIFVIRDIPTKQILFIGRVVNPTK